MMFAWIALVLMGGATGYEINQQYQDNHFVPHHEQVEHHNSK